MKLSDQPVSSAWHIKKPQGRLLLLVRAITPETHPRVSPHARRALRLCRDCIEMLRKVSITGLIVFVSQVRRARTVIILAAPYFVPILTLPTNGNGVTKDDSAAPSAPPTGEHVPDRGRPRVLHRVRHHRGVVPAHRAWRAANCILPLAARVLYGV